jgi:hypothetical protein
VRISIPEELRQALEFLIEFRPLATEEVIVWTTEEYYATTERGRMVMFLPQEFEKISALRDREVSEKMEWSTAFINATPIQIARWLNEVESSILVTSSLQDSMQLLLPNRATEDTLDAYCRATRLALPDSSRTLAARQLAALAAPGSVCHRRHCSTALVVCPLCGVA